MVPAFLNMWNHAFNEVEHISLIHAKYGSNHAEKELAKTQADENEGTNQQSLKTQQQVPYHILAEQFISNCNHQIIVSQFPLHFLSLPYLVYLAKNGPPPKLV